jgi:hypothetical protein
MSNKRDFTCRTYESVRCQHYAAGHNTHWIHAKHVGRSPWGWRDGVVRRIDGLWLTVDYVQVAGALRVWHHESSAASSQSEILFASTRGCTCLAGPSDG